MELAQYDITYLVRLYFEKLILLTRRQQAKMTRWVHVDALVVNGLVTTKIVEGVAYFVITDNGLEALYSYPKSVWVECLIEEGMWHEAKYFIHFLSKEELTGLLVHKYESVRELAKQRWRALDPNDGVMNAKITFRIRRRDVS